MSEVIVILEREKFKELKGRDVVSLILQNLPKVEKTLEAEREEFLREKIGKLKERLERMNSEIEELREFYEKALRDKEFMMAERDRLRVENAELRKKLEGKRNRSFIRGEQDEAHN